MRFHFGISVRPKNIIKWVLLALFGLLAFLGIGGMKEAKALALATTGGGGFATEESGGTVVGPFATVNGVNSSTIYLSSSTADYLNLAWYNFSISGLNKGQTYYFSFTVSEACNNYLDCDYDYQSFTVASFRIMSSQGTYYLDNVACVNRMLTDGSINCSVVPGNNYTNVDNIRISLYNRNYWANNNYTLSGMLFYDTSNNYNTQLQSIQNSINNLNTSIQSGFTALSGSINSLKGSTDDIYDDLTDNSNPSSDISSLGSVSSLLPSGPVDSLLAIPVTFLNKTITALGGTCSPYTFTFVFDEQMTLPCFEDLYDEFPSSLKIFCDTIPAGFLLIAYFKHLYKKVDRATSLNADSNDDWGVI